MKNAAMIALKLAASIAALAIFFAIEPMTRIQAMLGLGLAGIYAIVTEAKSIVRRMDAINDHITFFRKNGFDPDERYD